MKLKKLRREASEEEISKPSQKELGRINVHFGAGKLGLGFVIPLLKNCDAFYIWQRNSSFWKKVSSSEKPTLRVELLTNNNTCASSYELKVGTPENVDTLLNNNSKGGHLILVDDHEQISKALFEAASTFSCAVGTAGLDSVAASLKAIFESSSKVSGASKVFYACENDHEAIEALSESLRNCYSEIKVAPCMVDRICTHRFWKNDILQVVTESFAGELVVKNCDPLVRNLTPFKGEFVSVPAYQSQASYLAERKFLLVNGTHTTLAFMTMEKAARSQGLVFEAPGDLPLLKDLDSSETEILWSWCVARILILLWEYDLEVLKDFHRTKTDEELVTAMFTHARNCVIRILAMTDTTKRVLGGGVTNRWKGRLRSVEDFFNTRDNLCSSKLAKLVLAKAGMELVRMYYAIHLVVEAGRSFTDLPTPRYKFC